MIRRVNCGRGAGRGRTSARLAEYQVQFFVALRKFGLPPDVAQNDISPVREPGGDAYSDCKYEGNDSRRLVVAQAEIDRKSSCHNANATEKPDGKAGIYFALRNFIRHRSHVARTAVQPINRAHRRPLSGQE